MEAFGKSFQLSLELIRLLLIYVGISFGDRLYCELKHNERSSSYIPNS